MGKLSARIASSAKQITSLIRESVENVTDGVRLAGDSQEADSEVQNLRKRAPGRRTPSGTSGTVAAQGFSFRISANPAAAALTSSGKSDISCTWRISITSSPEAGHRLAHSIASSFDFTWIIQ